MSRRTGWFVLAASLVATILGIWLRVGRRDVVADTSTAVTTPAEVESQPPPEQELQASPPKQIRAQPKADESPRARPKNRPVEPDWGHLAGRFVLTGPIPEVFEFTANKDAEFCGQHRLVDESLVVNPTNRGIANVLVRLVLDEGQELPPLHELHQSTANDKVELSAEGCRFVPHVATLRTSQTLVPRNRDPVQHTFHFGFLVNSPTNPLMAPHSQLEFQVPKPERLPVLVHCRIHPWMRCWLVVSDHPHVALSDSDGYFEIENLPVGTWTFHVWHESAGHVVQPQQNGEPVTWPKGRFKFTICPGENQLGEHQLPAAIFENFLPKRRRIP